MKRPVLLIIIIPIFILIGAGVISLLRKPTQKEEDVAKENTQAMPFRANENGLNSIPPLPTKFTWTKLPSSEISDLYSSISVTKEHDIYMEEITLPGEVWISSLKQINPNEFDPDSDLMDYYQSRLTKANWNVEIESSGYQLNSIDADGGFAAATGYIDIDKDKIRAINIGYSVTDFDEKTQVRDATYWVFISDPTPLSKIIEQVKNN